MQTLWENIQNWLKQPELLKDVTVKHLQSIITDYPACEMIHWIYLKKLAITKDVQLDSEIKKHIIYISDHKLLYNYLFKKEEEENQNSALTTQLLGGLTGDYFSLMENQKHQQSLKNLALQLKEERLKRNAKNKTLKSNNIENKKKLIPHAIILNSTISNTNLVNLEAELKNHIKNKNYNDALTILRQLNLKNPKKSAYFADQIRFIETIIRNNK